MNYDEYTRQLSVLMDGCRKDCEDIVRSRGCIVMFSPGTAPMRHLTGMFDKAPTDAKQITAVALTPNPNGCGDSLRYSIGLPNSMGEYMWENYSVDDTDLMYLLYALENLDK